MALASSSHGAAQPEQAGEQGSGQRDEHDDAGDDDGFLELALRFRW
jgi:hypothetical protein